MMKRAGSVDARYVHTNIIAQNWQTLAQFYIEVFGCAVIPPERHLTGDWLDRLTGIQGALVDGVHLRLPGYEDGPTLEIFSYTPSGADEPKGIDRAGFGHIAFHVDDVRAVVESILAHGGALLGEIVEKDYETLGRLTAAYARDPEGNIIEVQNWRK